VLVDYERAFLRLKEVVISKKSHGQKDLLAAMAQIELDCRVEEAGYDPTPRTPSLSRPRAVA